jgi:histidinol-phosphate aminotransferase
MARQLKQDLKIMSDKSWPSWLPLNHNLIDMSPYGAPQLPVAIKLNTNENPYTLTNELVDKILKGIKEKSAELNRYPDRDAQELRTSLAKFINKLSKCNFGKDNIWVANGSNEIIQSIFLAFGANGALGFEPSYSVHKIIAQITNTKWQVVARNKDFSLNLGQIIESITNQKPSITFVTTPNNPTGTATTLDELKQIAIQMKKVNGLLVVDEAYAEFSAIASAATLIDEFENIIVIRTMSKAFAFAGVRVGYLIANAQVISAMMVVRLPYHLSTLTQASAQVALENSDALLGKVSEIVSVRDALVAQLTALGLTVAPTQANFILFTGFTNTSSAIWQGLVDKGILIRDVGLPGYLRVSVGSENENNKFISELKLLLRKES